MIISVGQPLSIMKDRPEGCVFTLIDDGMYLIVNFAAPTENEIKQVKCGAEFEIRYAVIEQIIMVTVKLGNLPWMECPFSPHLEVAAGHLHPETLETGLPLTIIMTDANTAVINSARVVGISASFSSAINSTVKRVLNMPFNLANYNAELQSIFNSYSTERLVTMGASNTFKLTDFREYSGFRGGKPYTQDNDSTIRKSLQGIAAYVSKRPYIETPAIPDKLEPYHYYIKDSGHCIVSVLETHLGVAQKENKMDDYEVPIPVKYVLENGYRIVDGYVVVDAPYDPILGLDVDEKYEAW